MGRERRTERESDRIFRREREERWGRIAFMG